MLHGSRGAAGGAREEPGESHCEAEGDGAGGDVVRKIASKLSYFERLCCEVVMILI